MPENVLARDVVQRHRVAVTVAGRVDLLLWLRSRGSPCKLTGSEQRARRARPSGVSVGPDRVLPAGDAAVVSQRCSNFPLHGGTIRLEQKFLLPSPLDTDRYPRHSP